MNELQNYVQTQRLAGYSDEQIKKVLASQGYDQATIDVAMKGETTPQEPASTPQQTQEVQTQPPTQTHYDNTQLQQYIYTYLQQGYAPQQLYEYLKGQGYSPHQLNQVFSQIDKQYYKGQMPLEVIHKHEVGGSSLVKIGAMILVVSLIVGGFFMFGENLFGEQGSVILDLVAEPAKQIIKPGEPVVVEIAMVNQGETNKVNVDFEYYVRNRDTEIILQDSETRAFSSTLEFLARLDLPADTPLGVYEVTVIARYGETPDKATFLFTISEQTPSEQIETCTAESKAITCLGKCSIQRNNCQDLVDCGVCQQIPVEPPEEKPEEIEPEKVNVEKTATDQTIFTQAIDAHDPGKAQGYCLEIKNDGYRKECLIVVAAQTNTPSICERIEDEESKEDCYMGFVLGGDTTYCSAIQLPENKQLCDQFIQLDIINDYLATGSQEAKEQLGIPDPTPVDVNNQPDPTLDDFFIGDVV